MAEGLFDIRTDDVGNLVAAFETMAMDADDIEGALEEAGRRVQMRTIENYRTEGALTDLGFWIMLSVPYLDWKESHFPGRQMLEMTSDLKMAVYNPGAVDVNGNEVTYTIEDEKAAWHQWGAERSKGGTLPPRPIIPDVGDVEPHIIPVFKDWVVDVIDHGESRVRDQPWTPRHPWWRPRSSAGTFLPFS